MRTLLILLTFFLLLFQNAEARTIRGKIKDLQSGEEIIGALVMIKDSKAKGTATGLDGSFQLQLNRFPCTLVCTCLGYKPMEITVRDSDNDLNIGMETDAVKLGEVVIVAENTGCSEVGARSNAIRSTWST